MLDRKYIKQLQNTKVKHAFVLNHEMAKEITLSSMPREGELSRLLFWWNSSHMKKYK